VKLQNIKSGLQEFRRRVFFARTVTLSFATGFLGNNFSILQPEPRIEKRFPKIWNGTYQIGNLGNFARICIFDFVRIFGSGAQGG